MCTPSSIGEEKHSARTPCPLLKVPPVAIYLESIRGAALVGVPTEFRRLPIEN